MLYELGVDVICLQETKVRDDKFPIEQINNIGYKHLLYTGDGGQCGVAILSKIKIDSIENINIINAGKRHIHFKLNNVNIHNFYIPAGGDEPDVNINPKFKQKLEYLDYIINLFSSIKSNTIILGDFNIAPMQNDVYDHKKLLKVVSHSPIEIEIMNKWIKLGNFVDIARSFVDENQKLYTWWSYRVRDSYIKDYGRRLDHIWCTQDLFSKVKSFEILKHFRTMVRPSDHVPVVCKIDI
jgi:exodeoxyribonuclease-3